MSTAYQDRYWNSADGLKLHFRDYPGRDDRPPVLCLHGLTRNARDFAGLAQHLAGDWRVIVPEVRGRGLSEYARDSSTYVPTTYVADLEILLAQEGIGRFVSIATSMGGLMTMMMAASDASRFAGVVLNDIGPEVNPAGLARIGGYVGQGRSYSTWMHAARNLHEVQGAAFPDYDIEMWLEMARRTMVLGQNGRISFDYDMTIAEPFRDVTSAVPPDLWPAIDALAGVPLTLLRGELSDLLSEDTVAKMRARHPGLQAVTIPRVGHAPTLDELQARAAIDDLLARVG
ncbi:MAG: alpha/beta hydrolase [Erythrobacter sp. RIFCSPHIGHO2_12_FULL_63_10]|nr:MAG: alpha/beta hydrolase [Erythrobacter sp. RIFCSPHIGHO2_12_FULL_63_10]